MSRNKSWFIGAAGAVAAAAALLSTPAVAGTSVYVQIAPAQYGHGYYGHSGGYGGGQWVPQSVWSGHPGYQGSYGYQGRRGRDQDRDGIPDRYDRDRDNDGRVNWHDRDRDGDGVPNHRDRAPDNRRRY
ncbi:hypothetical protein FN976_22340 [Caenimonas sedimenti]|uniref:Uncharacterized protein n=1 Tax=Caenimonas sedimenti TaxID=2596921 RepID=A0A562ZJH7_9BURK|nr:hypothetical protein [Caenimonas sedimenti]TWO68732.1 hypothetical protein FN976_22340 [Caenimonas sedimenti]